ATALFAPGAAPDAASAAGAGRGETWATPRSVEPEAADRVLVKLRGDRASAQSAGGAAAAKPTAGERMAGLASRTGVTMRSLGAVAPDLHVVRLEAADAAAALARLRADADVEYVEPDRRMRRHLAPNDPLFANQWYLRAVTTTPNGPTASATDTETAWDGTRGSSTVVVAVLDTGVRLDHPDLGRVANGGKLLPGYDFVSAESNGQTRTANDGDGWDDDPSDPGDWVSQADRDSGAPFTNCSVDPTSSWHGTRVSGIIAARTNNAAGIAGVGFDTRILPVRVLGKCGGFTSDIIAGMRWAAGLPVQGVPTNPNPARILNLSLGGDGACSNAYQAAIDEIVTQRQALVIVSAGNDGSTADQPANCRGVAAIGALRHVGNKVGFSNLGPNLALSAPGGNCVNVGTGQPCLFSLDTTTNLGTTVPGADGYTDQFNANFGTSFSAPIVSGIAALMYAVHGTLTPPQVIARLRDAARPFPVVNETDPGTNQPIPQCRVPAGESDTQLSQCNCTPRTCGAGIADAQRALAAIPGPVAAVATSGLIAPGQTIQLDAAASTAGAGASVSGGSWSVQPGATGTPTFGSPTAQATSLTLPSAGALSVQLVVTDSRGASDTVAVPLLSVVPNVAGQTRAAAATALAAAGVEVGTVSNQQSATVAAGGVISQTPAAGSSVATGTPVALVVSSGAPPAQPTVPSVVGQSQSAATSTLTGAGFVVGTVTTQASTDVASGNVISQSPVAGTAAAAGTSVSLVVSSGPPAPPPPPSSGGGSGGGGGGGSLGVLDLFAALVALLLAAARPRVAARTRPDPRTGGVR
ncbi:MAG: S8 family serine peptidase, partial [Pseudomonadota bacterium]